MRSAHAGACFVRPGRCRFGSVFGLHFGVILGGKFATILLLGRPGVPERVSKDGVNRKKKKVKFWVPAGGVGWGGRDFAVKLRWAPSHAPAFSEIWERNRGVH